MFNEIIIAIALIFLIGGCQCDPQMDTVQTSVPDTAAVQTVVISEPQFVEVSTNFVTKDNKNFVLRDMQFSISDSVIIIKGTYPITYIVSRKDGDTYYAYSDDKQWFSDAYVDKITFRYEDERIRVNGVSFYQVLPREAPKSVSKSKAYVIKAGDTAISIGKKFGVSQEAVLKAAKGDIQKGKKIIIN